MPERFPPVAPADLTPIQEVSHNEANRVIQKYLGTSFTTHNKEKAVIGPFAHFLYMPPDILKHHSALLVSIAGVKEFTTRYREIAILAVGEYYGAPYELYSHVRLAKSVGLSDLQIEDILAGRAPSEGSEQDIISWEVARALVGAGNLTAKGHLSEELWKRAEKALGKTGAGALVHFTGYYAYLCMILNAGAVDTPEGEVIWPVS
ncbi:hypothetical protein TWF718_005799 [Orbilia javanica]|uniref:Carboxymuconolactone decarboxylase-like domain-containing protein n=1 Tax=Orbilia javanica TaxID=47235 RepID=A0AAN8RJ98_9PEZI